jgi:Pumilio-family RNA binding repeat
MDRDLSDNIYQSSKSPAPHSSSTKKLPTQGPALEYRCVEEPKGGCSKNGFMSCCWKKLSDRIEANHSAHNLSFRALAARLPLKDSVHMKFHEIVSGEKQKAKANNDSLFGSSSLRAESLVDSSLQDQPQSEEICTSAFRDASFETMLHWATESKASSLRLQRFCQDCPNDCLWRLAELVEKHASKLLTHRFGSYLVQKLVPRCSANLGELIRYCKLHFSQLAKNEFSSRALQKLIEHSPAFRGFAMSTFKSDLELYTKDVASGYLVAAGILQARSEEERDVLSGYLQSGKSKWYESKYAKKVIIVYLSACAPDKLDSFFHSLQVGPNLLLFMQDKHSCNILLTFLARRHALAQSLVLHTLTRNPVPLVRTKFFGYFIAEVSRESHTSELAAEIGSVLRSISQQNFRALLSEAASYQIFSGAVSLTRPPFTRT